MTTSEIQAKRDRRVLVYVERKGGATRAEILYDLATLCGGERGIDTTIGRLLGQQQIEITHGARESKTIGRKVAVYTVAKAAAA